MSSYSRERLFHPASPLGAQPTSPLSESGSFSSWQSQIPEDTLQVPQEWFIKDIKIDPSHVLGRGSFGTVCIGEWLGSPVAVKRLHEVFFESSVSTVEKTGILRTFARELTMLFNLKHPNIVMFFGVHDTSGRGELTLTPDTCLIQELLCCSLGARNRQEPRLTYRNVVDISIDVVSALRYLHCRAEPIVHRDLASKNVLLTQEGVPKIADLGVAKVISSTQKFAQHSRQPGTDLYMPPEVKVEGAQYDYRIDIYSFGVILMEISIGRDPTASEAFRVRERGQGGLEIVLETERRRRDLQDLGESPLRRLVLRCLARKDDRPTAREVHETLKVLQKQREYTCLPVIPIIPDSSAATGNSVQQLQRAHARCEMLEQKLQSLRLEKDLLQKNMDALMKQRPWLSRAPEESTSSFPMSELEQLRMRNAQLEKALQQHSFTHSGYPSPSSFGQSTTMEQERLRLLEATIRSRDSEVADLRRRNIALEQELGQYRTESLVNGFTSSYERPTPRGYMARGVLSSSSSSPRHSLVASLPASSSLSSAESSEAKQMKRQLEKYKNLTMELDMKLKDARLEISRYESRKTSTDVQARYEIQALQAENQMLRSDLDRATRDNSRLQQDVSYRRYDGRPY